MDRNKSIFIAFVGPGITQPEAIFEIGEGYECWNLKKFEFDEFIKALKEKIPPLNDNILANYRFSGGGVQMHGITEEQFKDCSWGLFIPDTLGDASTDNYDETIFLLNLFSSEFLYPLFYGSDFGIKPKFEGKLPIHLRHQQNQSNIFKTEQFIRFFKALVPQSQYGVWYLDRVKEWDKEDWRLFVASFLFKGLESYDNRKDMFGWQRESADMATALESLFTAKADGHNEEIGYKLRKRMAALLSWKFPSIEDDLKGLYDERSAFVHGSFFARLAKGSKKNDGQPPLPDFGLLYKQKEYVRMALVACLHLANSIKDNPEKYKNNTSIIDVFESSIIDIELRNIVVDDIKELFSLMPAL